jgi:hypothetical protein
LKDIRLKADATVKEIRLQADATGDARELMRDLVRSSRVGPLVLDERLDRGTDLCAAQPLMAQSLHTFAGGVPADGPVAGR